MIPAISQVCSLPSPWDKDVEDYAAGACGTMEVWLTKLEMYLERHSLDDCRRLLVEHRMSAPVASIQGGLFEADPAARQEHWRHFDCRLDLCRQLQIGTLVVAGDLAGPCTEEAWTQAIAALAEAADRAAERQVRLAFKFLARATLANNLQSAAAIVAAARRENLGVCLDVMQYYLGPSKLEDLAIVSAASLFHVQVCDLAGQLRETAADADRILPGEGDFQLEPILAGLRAIGYEGLVTLELMNPRLWQVPARQLGEIGMTALRKLLGQAKMR
jgi:4-hydroxyphenylpyruvate dioxygenase